jgi:hypothetical protein
VKLDTEFLILPVYRVSSENYYIQREEFVERNLYGSNNAELNLLARQVHKEQPQVKLQSEAILRNSYGSAWDFNEIIGYIKLHFVGTEIRGEYWAVKSKRIVKSSRKEFEYKTHKLAPEISIPQKASNNRIYGIVISYVKSCRLELKNRYIDDSQLKIIGPFVNWRKLMQSYTL